MPPLKQAGVQVQLQTFLTSALINIYYNKNFHRYKIAKMDTGVQTGTSALEKKNVIFFYHNVSQIHLY